MHSNQFNVLLKMLAVVLAATLYLAETATPQFEDPRLIPLEVPTNPSDPDGYEGQLWPWNHLEDSIKPKQNLPSKKFVVYGRASTHERVGISLSVAYLPIRYAREPEVIPDNDPTFQGTPNTQRMPDLEDFFQFGGTLELLTTDPTLEKYDIVMSELMWGVDGGINTSPNYKIVTIKVTIPDPMDPSTNKDVDAKVPQLVNQEVQWIELYNTTDAAITADLYLLFTPFESHPDRHTVTVGSTPYTVLDAVSNLLFGKWQLPGKSGKRPRTTLVSAYRNIDYETVKDSSLSRAAQLGGIPFGSYKASWVATPDNGRRNTDLIIHHHLTDQFVDIPYIATPGTAHVPDIYIKSLRAKPVNANTVVINEVRNDTSTANVDWVELKNVSTRTINLKDWELSIVTKVDADNELVRLPAHSLGRGELLVILNVYPDESDLADGIDIEEPEEHRSLMGLQHKYLVSKDLDLPNKKKFVLLLRSKHDQNGKDAAIEDYAGNGFFTDGLETQFWPRLAQPTPKDVAAFGTHTFASRHEAWARVRYQKDDGHHKDAWAVVETQGGLGYAPGADLAYAPGTPGYENTALKTQMKNRISPLPDAEYDDGEISFSEIMYDTGESGKGVQWIELYNSSMTQAVSLTGWELEIVNLADEAREYVNGYFAFEEAVILPNAALLLVSRRITGTDVSTNRVYDLYRNHRHELGLARWPNRLLNPNGFYLKLTDKANTARRGDDIVVDAVGNLNIDARPPSKTWDLPPTTGERRRSIIRLYGGLFKPLKGGLDGKPNPPDAGLTAEGWRRFPQNVSSWSYYGDRKDLASPGYRLGGSVPVVLSSFRPVRQETGDVLIRWRTASELNNAGFNILRRAAHETRFRVINVKGIVPGQGTSSEMHQYAYTDPTAQPNTVYYYRLEDVSFDGVRQPLATVRLKGDIAAAGKLTTSWGILKSERR